MMKEVLYILNTYLGESDYVLSTYPFPSKIGYNDEAQLAHLNTKQAYLLEISSLTSRISKRRVGRCYRFRLAFFISLRKPRKVIWCSLLHLVQMSVPVWAFWPPTTRSVYSMYLPQSHLIFFIATSRLFLAPVYYFAYMHLTNRSVIVKFLLAQFIPVLWIPHSYSAIYNNSQLT